MKLISEEKQECRECKYNDLGHCFFDGHSGKPCEQRCDKYTNDGKCLGTREIDPVYCGGDKAKCIYIKSKTSETSETVKPPLGIVPHCIWVDKRIVEILDAVERYSIVGKVVPVEWVEELWKLIDERLGGGIMPDEE